MSDITVVGIGADGWDGLPPTSRQIVENAEVVYGSARQLASVPARNKIPWPSPMLPALRDLPAKACVLASGDPMFYGVGGTLVRLLGADRVRVIPHPSSVSLACARLGWPVEETEVISAVGRPLATLNAVLGPGRRILVLSADETTPARVAGLATGAEITVLEQLGGPHERIGHDVTDALNIVAIQCPDDAPALPATGLPDDAYEHDGQLTKREVRAVTLASLTPVPGRLLWDVGAGAGSVAIEWMRAHRTCRAIAIEDRADRAERIAVNAASLGVPGLTVIAGRAPGALDGLEPPDAIFIGGGVAGSLDACWDALKPGGRLVVNAVTLESEALLTAEYGRRGGELTKLAVSRAVPVGGFTGWRAMMPVTQWTVTKP